MKNNYTLGDVIESISITHKFPKDEVVFLNTSDVYEGKILIDNYMPVNKLKGQAKKTIKNGDILFSEIRPKNRRYAYVKNIDNIEDYVVSTKLMVLRNKKEDIDMDYIYYFLTSSKILNYLQMRAENRIGSFPQITFDILKPIQLKKISLEEQQKIASILSTIDKKIALNNQINQELEAMTKTLYDYWFVQFDFPNEEGKPYKSSGGKMVYSEELKREIPEGWEVKELKHIVEVSNDSLDPMLEPDKDFKHYSIPVFDDTKTYAIEKGKTIKSNKFVIKENDILVSKLNPKFNRVVYPIDEEDLISSTEFVVWRAENIATKNYLYILAKHKHFISFCMQSASGTSNSHKRVNPTVMMDYNVVFNKDISNVFGTKIHPMLKQIIKNQKQTQKLTQLRDWLLPMLMNGQVSVADATEQVEELMVAEPLVGYGRS